MSNIVKQTKEINDAASLSSLVDIYLDSEFVDIDETFEALANIMQKCADGHHQTQALAVVAVKLAKGMGEA